MGNAKGDAQAEHHFRSLILQQLKVQKQLQQEDKNSKASLPRPEDDCSYESARQYRRSRHIMQGVDLSLLGSRPRDRRVKKPSDEAAGSAKKKRKFRRQSA